MKQKIQMTTPLVEMDGDEMTRFLGKKARWIFVFSIVAFLSMLLPSCSAQDHSDDETFSLSQVINKEYPMEIVHHETLPRWLQEKINEELSYPNSFVVKAKSGSETIYILSSLSSVSPLEFYCEDGTNWHGSTTTLHGIVIIYWKS